MVLEKNHLEVGKKVEKTSFCIFPFPKVDANAKKWGEISGSFILFPVKEARGKAGFGQWNLWR